MCEVHNNIPQNTEMLSMDKIKAQNRSFLEKGILNKVPDMLREAVLVTNSTGQIIYANKALLKLTDAKRTSDLLGFRPGRVLRCVHTLTEDKKYCAQCGSLFSLLLSQKGKSSYHDFSLSRLVDGQIESLDLNIFTRPINVEGEKFYFFSITDVSHEKRRAALERIFFHDVLNTAGGLRNMAQALKDRRTENSAELLDLLYQYANQLVQEIEAQKILRAAERGDLKPRFAPVNSFALLQNVVRFYEQHNVAQGKIIEISPDTEIIDFISDINILNRVIGNMIKNALEASKSGEKVKTGCRSADEQVKFWVHNPAVIPEDVQIQIFKRSFSTKGSGRGLGTYGMKLLSEHYLKGRVSFSSDENGTVFYAVYPK